MVTSARQSAWPLDWLIENLASAGLRQPCLVRLKLYKRLKGRPATLWPGCSQLGDLSVLPDLDLAALLPGGPGWTDVQRSLKHDPEGPSGCCAKDWRCGEGAGVAPRARAAGAGTQRRTAPDLGADPGAQPLGDHSQCAAQPGGHGQWQPLMPATRWFHRIQVGG